MRNKIAFLLAAFIVGYNLYGQVNNCFLYDYQPKAAVIPASVDSLKPSKKATVVLKLKNDTICKVSKYVFGNAVASWCGSYTDPELIKATKLMEPSLIRYPGGTWSDGWFVDKVPTDLPDSVYDGSKYNGNIATTPKMKVDVHTGTQGGWVTSNDSYYAFRKAAGVSEGLMTINYAYARIGTSKDPVAQAAHEAANWVRLDNGRTKYWEIGNESAGPWEWTFMIDTKKNQDGQPTFISGALYGKHFKVYVDSMKAAAKKIGATIYIGGQVQADEDNGTSQWSIGNRTWNEGFFKQVGDSCDFYVIHNYFSNSSVVKELLSQPGRSLNSNVTYIWNDIAKYNAYPKPIALTEYNMTWGAAPNVGSSFEKGMQASVLMCEMIKNKVFLGARWYINGIMSGSNYGANYENKPNAEFYYLAYLKKYFGDVAINVTSTNSNVLCYASRYSGGETGMVVVNAGDEAQTVSVLTDSLGVGDKYYIYSFTSNNDSAGFSPSVFINGVGPDKNQFGPLSSLFTIKAVAYTTDGKEIKFISPGRSLQLITIEKGAYHFPDEEGAPAFISASITDANTKQIQVLLSKAIVAAKSFSGFTLKIDGTVTPIDSVVRTDTSKVTIYISQSISKENAIALSFSNGNVFAVSNGKKLIKFTDQIVDNLLKGASPRIIEATTDINGGKLILKFSKKMQLPSDVSALALKAQYNEQINIPILQGSFLNNDSTTLSFPLDTKVYGDYTLLVTYSGSNFASADGGLMKAVTDFPVTNVSNGLPVHITSGKIGTDGITLSLEFSKPMVLTSSPNFVITINGSNVAFSGYSVSNNIIQLTLAKYLHVDDSVKISYTPGSIKAIDNGPLDAIANFKITNLVAPVWITVPGKIEAENFVFKSGGLRAEATSDYGLGQNIGYIANGNWLEYAIENNSIKTNYQISFRLAAPYTGGIIDYYIDNKSAGRVTVPSTGGWQVYQSVTKNISISPGKHYLKVVATTAGFNFNYMDVLPGTTPQITEVSTNEGGDTLKAKFNTKMRIPLDISALALNAQYNGSKSISILPGSFFKGDSTTLFFPLGEKVYKEYKLLLTYSGNNIMSTDSCLLKTFSDLQVTNNSNGLPAHINSGKIGADGFTLSLEFSKPLVLANTQTAYFTLYKNGESIAFKNYSVSNSTIQFTLSKNIHYGDTVTISYTPGDIKTTDKGTLEGFSGFAVANQVSVPTWITIPGKIEAEKFVFKSGMQTENTNDLYGGQILGSINDGDWAEYAIKNDSSKTDYQISFRVAAPTDGGIIDYYVDEKSAGNVTIPSTGSLQVYQLVVKDISITTGKHYLKAVVTKGGFNFNYMNIYKISTSIEQVTESNTTIYPNPVSNEITISSVGFKYNKIEIFDALGKSVISKETDEKPVFHLPVSLPDGIYFLKISSEKQYVLKKFMVVNK